MKKILFALLLSCVVLAEITISPNMSLPVPIVGTTPGPDWANNINSCMGAIDEHDHTPGHGVQISSSAIDINSDFSLNNNSLTETESVTFTAQSSFSTRQAVYVISPDLIYNDGNGNVIRLTQNGSVSGSTGTITGLPSGTASASYQSGTGTFQFQSSTNTPANITGASVSLAQQTTSPNTVTLKSPNSLASSYNVTFPTTVPSFTSLLTMSTSGVLSTVGYGAPTVQKFTSGSGTYTLPTGPSPIYLKLEMVGGGGGGASSTAGGGVSGSNGANSFFGSTIAGGGTGATNSTNPGGAGGTATLVSCSGIGVDGGYGNPSGRPSATTLGSVGGNGGSSALGGAGGGNTGNAAGYNATANTGSGGGGGGGNGNNEAGAGGGASAYVNCVITSPSSTYSYSVGAGGAGGTSGNTGGNGGSGLIVVTEFYQ